MQFRAASVCRAAVQASYARLTIENGRATLLELVDEDGSLLRKESL